MTPRDFKDAETRIGECLQTVIEALCQRCALPPTKPRHHHGPIHKPLIPRAGTVGYGQLDAYFDNVEHGFFHGVCTYIAAGLATDQPRDERLMASTLLHDFVKTIGGDPETHDSLLRDVYPGLQPVTYCHSKPPAEYTLDPLVVGDREELFRFPDAHAWVEADWPHRKSCQNLGLLGVFYGRIRPALERVFRHRHAVWIRHGIEGCYMSKEAKEKLGHAIEHWPVDHYGKDQYAVELDKPPFTTCADHGLGTPWRELQGFAPLLKPDDNVSVGDKDHVWYRAKRDIGDWTFFAQNAPARFEHQPFLRQLPLCSFGLLHKFWHAYHLLECKLKALC